MISLSVNVDHVATLRQARGVSYPSPVEAAHIAEQAGASGITVHIRGDRRHIQDADVGELRTTIRGKLNLEMAATDEMVALALRLRPDQITLVPERPEEITTEGGLDLTTQGDRVLRASRRLAEAGLAVSVFLDPDLAQIEALAGFESQIIEGFEINTDTYTRQPGSEELAKIARTASLGEKSGFKVYAGHGLTTENVASIAAIPQVEELNIGHSIISRAVLIGMQAAVREMLVAMD